MTAKDPLDCGECYHGHDCHACLQLAYNSLESLVQRQAELLERAKHWVILAKAHEHWESLQEGTEPDYDAEDAFLKDLETLGEE